MARWINLLVMIALLSNLVTLASSSPLDRSDLFSMNHWGGDPALARIKPNFQSFLPLCYLITNNGTHTFAHDKNGYTIWTNADAAFVLNSAISSTLAKGGGKILVNAAVYEIYGTVKIAGSNLELVAEKGAVLRTASDLSATFQISSETGATIMNVSVSGLTLDGNNYRVTDPFHGVIWVYEAQNIAFDDIEVTRSGIRENYMGRMLVPQAGLHARNVQEMWIHDCYIHDNSGSGIIVSSADSIVSKGIYISHNRLMKNNMSNATGGYAAIDLRGRDFIIAFNRIYRAPFGVHLAGNFTANGQISRNIFIGNAGDERIAESGIEIWSEGVSYISIKHNYFAKWLYEKGGGGAGIELGNYYSKYARDGVHHCEVAYNIMDCGGYPQSFVSFGITINGKYNDIYSNTIHDPNPEGIAEIGISEFNQIYRNKITYTEKPLFTSNSCIPFVLNKEDASP